MHGSVNSGRYNKMYVDWEISTMYSLLSNIAFATLLASMLLYWGDAAFGTPLRRWARQGMWIAQGSLTSVLILRWIQSGHFPLSNLYESCLFLSWALTAGHLALESWGERAGFREVGVMTAPVALFLNAFATLSLPAAMQEAAPLVPALRSHWLMMHVSLMLLSYAALLCGSLLAIGFLVVTGGTSEPLGPASGQLAQTLDFLSYRTLGIGFPLLTVGILSGAVWANEAWGSYWSWDPKETWALITWLVFAMYLHSRLNYGWRGQKPAILASLGFLVVWVCYLGVNLMGKGLHSYGWLQ